MNDLTKLSLDAQIIEKLEAFSVILGKGADTIVKEALENYFLQAEKMILEKSIQEKDPDTDIGFDEFWGGVDL